MVEITYAGYIAHRVASIVSMATEIEQEALRKDIESRGQLQPILLYRGKIVDGRCRARACESIGIDVIVEELPHKTSIERVREMVKSLNTRRNLTASQKACSCYREYKQYPTKFEKEAYETWGITKLNFIAAKSLYKNDLVFFELIEAGSKVTVTTKAGVVKTSSNISTIAQIVKELIENKRLKAGLEPEETGWDAESYIKTEAGKRWFATTADELRSRSKVQGMFRESDVLAKLARVSDYIVEEV